MNINSRKYKNIYKMNTKKDNSKEDSKQSKMIKFKSVKVDLKFCRGITNFKHDFHFQKECGKRLFVVYAPNGTMKTSFAETLRDISKDEEPKSHLSGNKKTYNITNEKGEQLKPNNIIVVNSINKELNNKVYAKTLLGKQHREKYNEIMLDLKNDKNTFLTKIASLAGYSVDNCEKQIMEDFPNIKDFTQLITTLSDDPCFTQFEEGSKETNLIYSRYEEYEEIKYQVIFNDKTTKILKTVDFVKSIEQYIKRRDELVKNSKYLTKEFDDYNIKNVKKNLEKNNLFNPGHVIHLNYKSDNEKIIINNDDFEELINQDINIIEKDDELDKNFKKIEKALESHEKTRDLCRILTEKNFIIKKLEVEEFRIEIWKNYFCICRELYNTLVNSIKTSKQQIEIIKEEIKKEFAQNTWQTVLDVFESRFSFPYKIEIDNPAETVLYDKVMPEILFKSPKNEKYEQEKIIPTLSSGEERALYILDLIYKLELKDNKDDTLVILDDIVESFDYKNKYAMIQYIREFSQEFNVIALTHNFDFFRGMAYNNASPWSTEKNEDCIKITQHNMYSLSKWFEKLDDDQKLISSIPVLRNVFELLHMRDEKKEIEAFLHYNTNIEELTMQNLKCKFETVVKNSPITATNEKYLKRLSEIITKYSKSNYNELEFKIILAIAIRIYTEKFLMKKLDVNEKYDMRKMFQDCKKQSRLNECEEEFIDKIVLIVKEYIHLNAFMYEPLMDIDVSELIDLHEDISEVLEKNNWKLC